MDYQGSVYYYDGYSNFMKGKSQWWGKNLEEGSGARRDWYEGYTHAAADHDSRMKREMQHSLTQVDTENQQFESLASNPVAVWKSEGLPPVGCICEAAQPGQIEWDAFKVIAVNSGAVFGFWDNGVASALDGDHWKFRPTRTEEDRKREEIISDLMNALGHAHGLFDLNQIYNALSSGMIRHVKVEVSDE